MRELDQEKMKTETALHDFLPTSIVRDLKKKKVLKYFSALNIHLLPQVSAEMYECVTIFFGDIIGFYELTSDCTPTEV